MAATSTRAALPDALVIPESALVLGEKVGTGAFGVVYKATLNGLPVCVKVCCTRAAVKSCLSVVIFPGQAYHALLNPTLYNLTAGSPEHDHVIAELTAEALLLAACHHNNILGFRGVCFDNTLPKYIVVELAESSLSGYLRDLGRKLSLREFRCFWDDVLDGLVYLHNFGTKGVVHRDLKPENVLVFFLRKQPFLKIADVGLARILASTSRSAMSQAGSMFYMAKEVLLGEGYDGRADIFSFGVMMSEIVLLHMTDSPPPPRFDMGIRMQMTVDPNTALHALTPPLAELLELCCAKSAKNRITSVEALKRLRAIPDCMDDAASASAAATGDSKLADGDEIDVHDRLTTSLGDVHRDRGAFTVQRCWFCRCVASPNVVYLAARSRRRRSQKQKLSVSPCLSL